MTAPTLSNYLTVLATQAGEQVIAYRRGSVEAINAYPEAGALLAEARAACKRGEWKEVCSVAGVSPAVSRNMRQLAAAGLSPETIHARGGIQASLDGLRKRTARPGSPPPGLTNADRARARRTARRAAGRCIDCGRPAPARARCEACTERRAARSQHRRELARIGESLADRLRAAGRARAGTRLTAGEVQAILAPGPPTAD